MKLLVDENLPPRLIRDLADLFPDSIHIRDILPAAPDAVVWEYAKAKGLALLTKDGDFANLSIALGAPPKVILLQTGNCSAAEVIRIVRHNGLRFSDFDRDASRGLLILR